jgi:hypothetical protein
MNGGSPITSYNLQYDSGTSGATWTNVIGFSPAYTGTSTILSTGIIAGTTYKFKLRLANIHGWGPFSSITSIKASQVPDTMSAVTTSIDSSTGGVTITWSPPTNDGSETIDTYLIEISNKAGTTWTVETLSCDGSNAAYVSAKTCTIPMTVLTASPYSYTFDDLVVVRAKARNVIGFATSYSPVNTSGAKIRSIPSTMVIPTLVSYTDTSLSISWTALTSPNNGNSAILAYNV